MKQTRISKPKTRCDRSGQEVLPLDPRDPDIMRAKALARQRERGLPCEAHDPDLWFADVPADLERAKALCTGCPMQAACLAGAIDRAEYAGVWGGQIFDRGQIVSHKRGRGRPRKGSTAPKRLLARGNHHRRQGDTWVDGAYQKLHQSVAEHTAAVEEYRAAMQSPQRARTHSHEPHTQFRVAAPSGRPAA